ncbi:tetratricopeptide repeat protein, partial [Candidatus Babeliales bacterium]|nr:tetratricopeptide repeat protein [Candidatus Babeliales bacterium]
MSSFKDHKKNRKFYGTKDEVTRLEELEKKIALDPNDVESRIEKGFLCLDVFELETQEGLKTVMEALEVEPDNVDILFWGGALAYLGVGDCSTAEGLLERALKIAPDRADCLWWLADMTPSTSSNFEKIFSLYNQAVKLEPDWPIPRLRLIRMLIEAGRFDEAEEIAREGVKLFKDFELPEGASRM